MRRRILVATVSAVAVAVLLLGFPLAFLGAQLVKSNDLRELQIRAQNISRGVESRLARGDAITADMLEGYVGENTRLRAYIEVVSATGDRISAGEAIEGRVEEVAALSPSNTMIYVQVSYWEVLLRSAQVVALVVVAAVIAVGAGIAVAIWQANRLSAPLLYLAASAEQLGSGQVRPRLEPSGVEEIDLVAAELGRSSDRMAQRLAIERQFASDASHQLRTPLTALTMRIEEMALAAGDNAEVQEEARVSLEQIERLVAVVDDLLSRSRRAIGGTNEAVRLRDVVSQQEEEWEPTFDAAGRELVIDVDPKTYVLATPGGLAQVLATLIENSLKHGDGTTTVRSRASGTSGAVVIEVSDEGPGVPDDLAPRIFEREVTSGAGTGLGLALARDLAAADGGRLELAQRRPPVFALFLAGVPRALDPSVVIPAGSVVSSGWGRRRRPPA
ncbi:MAG: ATP-binding protein [Cellulomonadaceae bacterium]